MLTYFKYLGKALPKKSQNDNTAQSKKFQQSTGSAPIKQQHMNVSNKSNSKLPESNNNSNTQSTGAKKKTKFVNLYSNDGKVSETIMLKGRRLCECQASQHKLINNCLNCGRIVCEQEGSGPCLFCGELVCTNEEQQVRI